MEDENKFRIDKEGVKSLINSLSIASSLFDKDDKIGKEFYAKVRNTVTYAKAVSNGVPITEDLDIENDVTFISNCLRNLSHHATLLATYFEEIASQADVCTHLSNTTTNSLIAEIAFAVLL